MEYTLEQLEIWDNKIQESVSICSGDFKIFGNSLGW